MPVEDDLLQAILADPEDDAPRLVFADWCEENGRLDRADFIRAQIRVCNRPEDDPEREALDYQERWRACFCSADWDPTLGKIGTERFYRRGFVEEAEFQKCSDFLKSADRLFALAPVNWVTIQAPFFAYDKWAQCRHLQRLRSLQLRRFSRRKWSAGGLAQAISPPALGSLTELHVGANFGLGPDWAKALLAADHLRDLQLLNLTGNGTGDVGVGFLTSAPHLHGLKLLDLRGNGIGPDGVTALAGSPLLANVRELFLGIEEEFDETNPVGDAGVEALAGSPHLTRVRVLHLEEANIGDRGVQALASWPGLASVRKLDISFNNVTQAGIEALAASPHVTGLRRLNLYGLATTDAAFRAILDSPHLAGLREISLDLTGHGLSDTTRRELRARFELADGW